MTMVSVLNNIKNRKTVAIFHLKGTGAAMLVPRL